MTRPGLRGVFVRVPATTSNLGPGFDILGLALRLHDTLELRVDASRKGPAVVEVVGEGSGRLPTGEGNLAVRALRGLLPRKDFPWALRLRMVNGIPIGRGLGSSAAARLCGLLAAAALRGLEPESVLEEACRLEGHPDNAVPAFHGGLCASSFDGKVLRHLRLAPPRGLKAVVCVPDFEVSTRRARAALPAKVPLTDAVRTASRTVFLLEAFRSRRFDWLAEAMEDDLHQPYRAHLVPGLEAALSAALRAGAYGSALSGSGSSVLAFARPDDAARVGRAMSAVFARRGSRPRALVLDLSADGAVVRRAR